MDIAAACEAIRQCNDCFVYGRSAPEERNASVIQAVGVIKTFLENARADGRPIRELEVADHLLCTPEGMKWVMPFVLSAEAMAAWKRRVERG